MIVKVVIKHDEDSQKIVALGWTERDCGSLIRSSIDGDYDESTSSIVHRCFHSVMKATGVRWRYSSIHYATKQGLYVCNVVTCH